MLALPFDVNNGVVVNLIAILVPLCIFYQPDDAPPTYVALLVVFHESSLGQLFGVPQSHRYSHCIPSSTDVVPHIHPLGWNDSLSEDFGREKYSD